MTKSFLLVFFQVLCIIFLAVTGTVIPSNIILLIFEIVFVLFGLWAMLEMKFRFNIFPELLKNSTLVTSGPFRFVRHPIYSAGVFISLIWIINDFSITRFAVWIFLVIILNIKIYFEEIILSKEFPMYNEYKWKTKKLIPLIY